MARSEAEMAELRMDVGLELKRVARLLPKEGDPGDPVAVLGAHAVREALHRAWALIKLDTESDLLKALWILEDCR